MTTGRSNTPAQDELVALVAAHPGHSVCWYASQIGPHGSRMYGYRTVDRAVAAGRLVKVPADRRGWHLLTLPPTQA